MLNPETSHTQGRI